MLNIDKCSRRENPKNREAGYKMLQGQKEGWNYRGVAKNILSEKLVFESEGCEGASLADRWGRAFKAAFNTKVLWQITAGMLGEQQGSQCGWSLTFTGTDARNKIQEEQGPRCMVPKHIPLYQSQRYQSPIYQIFIYSKCCSGYFSKKCLSLDFQENKKKKKSQRTKEKKKKASIFAWGKKKSQVSINKNENCLLLLVCKLLWNRDQASQ